MLNDDYDKPKPKSKDPMILITSTPRPYNSVSYPYYATYNSASTGAEDLLE